MIDEEGYFLFRKKTGKYRWATKLFNSAGFVYFEKGEPKAYGVILRVGRYNWKRNRGQLQIYNYVIRYFDPPNPETTRLRMFTLEEIQDRIRRWDDETLTGYKTVALSKLGLTQYQDSFKSPFPLSWLYLGTYQCKYNPSWFVATGVEVRTVPINKAEIELFRACASPSEFQVKVRQFRRGERRERKKKAIAERRAKSSGANYIPTLSFEEMLVKSASPSDVEKGWGAQD
jgi:hypothetical protein